MLQLYQRFHKIPRNSELINSIALDFEQNEFDNMPYYQKYVNSLYDTLELITSFNIDDYANFSRLHRNNNLFVSLYYQITYEILKNSFNKHYFTFSLYPKYETLVHGFYSDYFDEESDLSDPLSLDISDKVLNKLFNFSKKKLNNLDSTLDQQNLSNNTNLSSSKKTDVYYYLGEPDENVESLNAGEFEPFLED